MHADLTYTQPGWGFLGQKQVTACATNLPYMSEKSQVHI